MSIYVLENFFYFDALAQVMVTLVCFIGTIVVIFSSRYMQGDANYYKFLGMIVLAVLSVVTMATANNLFILLVAWGTSNFLLLQLMIHEPNWKAARASACLARKTFTLGFSCLLSAFILLYWCTGDLSIQTILHTNDLNSPLVLVAFTLTTIAAMTQSSIWPFHRWLTSSLNSPTPVSAIMHAGLVNGGGFLIVRFAPLYSSQPKILTIIFVLGIGTALVGSLWKLMQHDVKRMLACSTMGQMGFMFAQCGLGLFPAAIVHLCCHGLFKANLFLGSSSTIKEKYLKMNYPPSLLSLSLALVCGILGSFFFALTSGKTWLTTDTTLILIGIAFIAASQFALTLLKSPWKHLLISAILTSLMGALYGISVSLVESMLAPLNINHPQPLNIFHFIGFALLTLAWMAMLFNRVFIKTSNLPRPLLRLYVKALNASQPHPNTITTHRNQYKYN